MKVSVHAACGRGSVRLWRKYNTLCTFGLGTESKRTRMVAPERSLRSLWLHLITTVIAGRVFSGFYLSVCMSVFPHDISKTALSKITKFEMKMFNHKSRYDTIYLRALRSWRNGQLSLAHGNDGTETKYWGKTKIKTDYLTKVVHVVSGGGVA